MYSRDCVLSHMGRGLIISFLISRSHSKIRGCQGGDASATFHSQLMIVRWVLRSELLYLGILF